MKPSILLRIAAALTLLHAVLHTIGGVFGKPVSAAAASVAAAMQATHFPVFGVTRSYAEFYSGLGICVSIFLTFAAVLLWQLAALVRDHGAFFRPILAVIALTFLVLGVVSYRYFFLGPVVIELMIATCLCLAVVATLRSPAAARV